MVDQAHSAQPVLEETAKTGRMDRGVRVEGVNGHRSKMTMVRKAILLSSPTRSLGQLGGTADEDRASLVLGHSGGRHHDFSIRRLLNLYYNILFTCSCGSMCTLVFISTY